MCVCVFNCIVNYLTIYKLVLCDIPFFFCILLWYFVWWEFLNFLLKQYIKLSILSIIFIFAIVYNWSYYFFFFSAMSAILSCEVKQTIFNGRNEAIYEDLEAAINPCVLWPTENLKSSRISLSILIHNSNNIFIWYLKFKKKYWFMTDKLIQLDYT